MKISKYYLKSYKFLILKSFICCKTISYDNYKGLLFDTLCSNIK